jgi:photosystem II stability/assembly factor-like uncharacterized protein
MTDFLQKPSWRLVPTGTNSVLFGVDVVNSNTIWAVGQTPGVVVRTVDGSQSWQVVTPPDAADLAFHDIQAFDRKHAVVLAIGSGDLSRIFHTADGGANWQEAFRNHDADGFFDSIAFFDHRHGLVVSDAVEHLRIIVTEDGGQTWHIAPTAGMPAAITDDTGKTVEGVHALTTSLVIERPDDAWFGTAGKVPRARVFHTRDRGHTWTAVKTPIPAGKKFGIASLSFRDRQHGLALGGGERDTNASSVVAATTDGGGKWTPGASLGGFRLGLARVRKNTREFAVAVGPSGSDFSTDNGHTWSLFDETSLRGINSKSPATCWAVGDSGMAAELKFTQN